jgi:hypothetical protein
VIDEFPIHYWDKVIDHNNVVYACISKYNPVFKAETFENDEHLIFLTFKVDNTTYGLYAYSYDMDFTLPIVMEKIKGPVAYNNFFEDSENDGFLELYKTHGIKEHNVLYIRIKMHACYW